MLRTLFFTVTILALSDLVFAQVRATTESGNRVLLFDNGTWKYEEKSVAAVEESTVTTAVIAAPHIVIDTTKIVSTDQEELFFLASPRLVKFFGEAGGKIRCKLRCSNDLGLVKVHLAWEFPVIDSERYFGWFAKGTKVTFTLDDGKTVEIVMGDERSEKKYEKSNFSMMSNASEPLTKTQIGVLTGQPARKVEVGWKKDGEEYNFNKSPLLMEALSSVL